MRDTELTRRLFIRRTATIGAVAVGSGYFLAACGGGEGATGGDGAAAGLNCADTTALTDVDRAAREALKYMDASEVADQNCANCQQFQAAADAATCGTCLVVKGTINPAGHCTAWVAKVTT